MSEKKKSKKQHSTKSSSKSVKAHLKRVHWFVQIAILVGLVIVLGGAIDYRYIQKNRNDRLNDISLYLEPIVGKVAKDKVLSVAVWSHSADQPVNAVQANLEYPDSLLEFLSIDTGGSSYEVQAQGSGGNGKVVIARGHMGELTGRHLVAKVNFRQKDKGTAVVKFAQGSALVRSNDASDILKETVNGRYDLEGDK